jgi:hypothetical protein
MKYSDICKMCDKKIYLFLSTNQGLLTSLGVKQQLV